MKNVPSLIRAKIYESVLGKIKGCIGFAALGNGITVYEYGSI